MCLTDVMLVSYL